MVYFGCLMEPILFVLLSGVLVCGAKVGQGASGAGHWSREWVWHGMNGKGVAVKGVEKTCHTHTLGSMASTTCPSS